MAMKCPDTECHDKVVRASYFIKGLGAVLLVLIIVLVTVALNISATEKKQDEKISQIKVIEEQVKQIKESTDKIGSKVDNLDSRIQIMESKQMTPAKFKSIVKEALKE